jgi:hypothetical protein
MPTTFNVIYLGVLPDLDTIEGNSDVENATALVGTTFGSEGDPLFEHFQVFSQGTGGYSGGTSNAYDQDNSPSEMFRIDGGANQVFDSALTYDALITYADGSTATITAVVFQDVNGNTYWAPEFSPNSDQTALEAGVIRSLTITGVDKSRYNGLAGDRETWDYVTCFTPGTLILTPEGQVPVESLRRGDMVVTRDRGAQSIRWIGRARRPATGAMVPVRIARGALGPGLPERDLLVSQQHRMLVSSVISRRMTGRDEVLVPAKKLVGLPGITLAGDVADVTYLHLLLKRHEIIFADGAPTESLMTGPMARQSVGPDALAEIEALFPELLSSAGLPARIVLGRRKLARLIDRHRRNGKPLLDAPLFLRGRA